MNYTIEIHPDNGIDGQPFYRVVPDDQLMDRLDFPTWLDACREIWATMHVGDVITMRDLRPDDHPSRLRDISPAPMVISPRSERMIRGSF